ncbi:hypothetical protein E2C01_075933 [Portunus trituberculatus]|uniref:Uncharacterized protein n=1 Tax=Portunus trituberculatus TaxID=210409 RepID=A0A5B7IH21_PORTR|nr:hypothetical protein [Portunus trituberculatus]
MFIECLCFTYFVFPVTFLLLFTFFYNGVFYGFISNVFTAELGTSVPRSASPLLRTCGPPNEVRRSKVRKNFQKCGSNRYGKATF